MIETGRTMSLVVDSHTMVKLENLNVSGTAQEITGAITNESVGLFPESAVTGLGITISGNGVLSASATDTLWQKFLTGAEVAYVYKRKTGAGLTQWTGNCVITSMSETPNAASESKYSFTLKLSGAPTPTPFIVMTPAAGALSAQVGVSATVATFAATGGNDPYAYTAVGVPPGLTLNSGTGVLNGTPVADSQGTYVMEVTATDDDGVAKMQRYTVVVAAA